MRLLAITLSAMCLAGCAPMIDSVVFDEGAPRSRPSRVAVYLEEGPPRPARVHGYLAARERALHKGKPPPGSAEASTQVNELAKEGARIGCDAIVVHRDDFVFVQRQLIGPDLERTSVAHSATCLVFSP